MAQSQILDLADALKHTISTTRASVPPPRAIADMDIEGVTEAFDAWCRGGESREMRCRQTLVGDVVTLFERGKPVAVGKGAGMVNALADALERLR